MNYVTPTYRTFMDVRFYKHPDTGYWMTNLPFGGGPGLMADTLGGMKKLIRERRSNAK